MMRIWFVIDSDDATLTVDLGDIGRALRSERLAVGVTAEAIHTHSRLGLNTIERFESGRGNPTLSTICRYVEGLQKAEQ